MENAARQTLDHPMTFETLTLGEGLRLFEGWALRDLASFRRRCKNNLIAYFDSFLKVEPPGPSSIWVGCPDVSKRSSRTGPVVRRVLPSWLLELLSQSQNDLELQVYTHPLDIHSRIRDEYVKALKTHLNCSFCMAVHAKKGFAYCAKLEKWLERARNKESVRPLNKASSILRAPFGRVNLAPECQRSQTSNRIPCRVVRVFEFPFVRHP
ncbi:hypothetical protein F5888DRAFT_1052292 [Russula emetica]|nr:hypothetical protein F5888DRAFT_1052292 [Russula emetica]